jgi:hypothetical protein
MKTTGTLTSNASKDLKDTQATAVWRCCGHTPPHSRLLTALTS